MPSETIEERLDRISTHWSVVFEAHQESKQPKQAARIELVHRYRGAIFRYLLKVVGNNVDLAEELCQEFALKLLKGELHRADPERGRFRDYVKAALINLIRGHFKSNRTWPRTLPHELADPDEPNPTGEDSEFARQWREEVLHQTWSTLHEERPVYHNLLRLRVDQPDLTSRQLAERYLAEHARLMTPANVRKTLERAHVKFADLLVREVAESLERPDRQRIRTELEELDLLKYCRSALDRWTAD